MVENFWLFEMRRPQWGIVLWAMLCFLRYRTIFSRLIGTWFRRRDKTGGTIEVPHYTAGVHEIYYSRTRIRNYVGHTKAVAGDENDDSIHIKHGDRGSPWTKAHTCQLDKRSAEFPWLTSIVLILAKCSCLPLTLAGSGRSPVRFSLLVHRGVQRHQQCSRGEADWR